MTLDSTTLPLANGYAPVNYRQQVNMGGSDVFGGPYQIQTPSGIVHSTQPSAQITPPPLPPRPNSYLQSSSSSMFSPYGNNYGFNSFGGGFNSNYGYGMGGFNSFNSFGGFGSGYGRPFGNPLDPEMRFIQMAEESSRSTFQSIESVVSTIGNIATMLDSTYFALTSSFRAILGLAANFSHLRGFFSKFFSTFAVFRTALWMYKKFLYILGISKFNPSTQMNLNEAFKDAEEMQQSSNDFFNSAASQQQGSGLAMVLFLTFIFTAPYLIMKLFGSIMNSSVDNSKNPSAWVNAIDAVVTYNFNADHPSELSVRAGQVIKIAPKEIQQLNRLLSTNWLLATADGKNVGLVPVNYIRRQTATNEFVYTQQQQQQQQPLPSQQTQEATIEQQSDLVMEPLIIKDENSTENQV
ncbi:hypothetical protein PVAND_005045 [Polypedilum vanderplanki]|uniref:Peroxisomal membrane protein PEX13 n=1 Tax=Polypedilum vanderplanki TaxID=319348 RepID=A0A9J6BYZ0_POLVA|nr:hypothetical protein PVAND_005045 [Polypedilum vanderplanki]